MIDARAAAGQPELGAAAIGFCGGPLDEALFDQALEHAREGAGMHVENVSQFARRQTREQADDAQHQSLRAGHAQLLIHALRRAIERVCDTPEQTHELQYFGERLRGSRGRGFLSHRLKCKRDRSRSGYSRGMPALQLTHGR